MKRESVAQQIVSILLENDTAAAQQFAQSTGWTFNPSKQYGSVNPEGLPPELLQQLSALENWEFTDRRANSPTRGVTFYVPVGSRIEDIQNRYQQKLKEFSAG